MAFSRVGFSLCVVSLATACMAPSAQHSGQAADHSAGAVSHGVAAAAMSTATVAAVPLVVAGGSLAITGAALESAGTASVEGGSQVLQATASPNTVDCGAQDVQGLCITPDAPPSL